MKLLLSLWLAFVIGIVDGEVDYDYFYLVLQWPESYCNTGKVTCYDDAWEYRFTLHGMWPQKNWQGVSCPGSPDFHFSEVLKTIFLS